MSKGIWLFLGILLGLLDQAVKLSVLNFQPEIVTYNPGAAFGTPVPQEIIIVLSFIIMTAALIFARERSFWWMLVFGGALGNLIDRLAIGKVVDFIDTGFWPSFNVADSFIVVGGLALIYFYVILEPWKQKT